MLLFLVSQPRSGSTLLQHVMASRSDVATLPEPWFMLHLVYGLRETGLQAEYNARFAFLALREFLSRISGGEDVFYRGIRSAAEVLYNAAARDAGKPIFLDKTPRYYHIIPDLHKTFPDGKTILLTRNPLAVFTSILNYNFHGNWFAMLQSVDRRHDLISAPYLVAEALKEKHPNTVHVRYEDLVHAPESTLRKLCHSIGIAFEYGMLNYGEKVKFANTSFVDNKSVYRHEQPVVSYVDAWKQDLDSVVKVSIAGAYLDALSDDVLDCYGFERTELEAQLRTLHNYRSGQSRRWANFLRTGQERDLPFSHRALRKLAGKTRGVRRWLRRFLGK